ncbi:MAG: prephenate dehydrogenase [Lachnospiraceae bacterium]|nr:prephenate dehydrogenase [Lachnospiraceae bacterium]
MNQGKHGTLCIGFVGLGLIGGSIAKSIRRVFPNYKLLGYDTDTEALKRAKDEGTLDIIVKDVRTEFYNCNYIFLCTPVGHNMAYLSILKESLNPDCIITDVGSVKSPIHEMVKTLGMEKRFIGGHPMVGSEKSGYSACNDRLIENAYYFLTPTAKVPEEKFYELDSFIEELGAMTVHLDAERHDEITAAISHVPHLIACELVHNVRKTDDKDGMLKQLCAGGFKDITRIASSSPEVWEQIAVSNRKNISRILSNMITDLQELLAAVDATENEYINRYFKLAGDYRDSVPDNAVGLMQKTYEVFLDIPDEPGELSKVLGHLEKDNISIKNIGIIHNREYEEGCLKLVLYDNESAIKTAQILEKQNYMIYKRK